jgi:hypothetical protein
VLVRPVLAAAEKWQLSNCMFLFNEDDPAHAGSDADTKLILDLRSQLSVMTKQIDKVLVLKATGTEVFRKLALELEPVVKDYRASSLCFPIYVCWCYVYFAFVAVCCSCSPSLVLL